MNGLIGSDLEYAVHMGGGFVPAGVLPITGTKGKPTPLKYGGVEIDCCAVEITPPPADNEEEFTHNILNLYREVQGLYPQCMLVAQPSVVFNKYVLKHTPHANVMGCVPDSNAWTGKFNKKPTPPANGLRSFGGHIHIAGGTTETIKACDLLIGMFTVLTDSDKGRRSLYGKAGAYRKKPYGVEYRVASNYWCTNEKLIRTMFRLVREAQSIEDEADALALRFGGPQVVQAAINNSNVRKAKEISDYFGIMRHAA